MVYKQPVVEIIKNQVEGIPGWSPEDQLFALYMLGVSTGHLDGDIWEIGSWCGRSSTVLALASRHTNNCIVHCIDLFPDRADWYENADGTFSFKVTIGNKIYNSYSEQTVWKEPFERDIVSMYEKYGDSLENIFKGIINKKGFSEQIKPYKGVAPLYAEVFSGFIRFAFIDGDHGYDAVCRDIKAVERFLMPGGWIAFDDAFSVYEGVNKAIEDLILDSNKYEYGQQLTRKCFAARRKV